MASLAQSTSFQARAILGQEDEPSLRPWQERSRDSLAAEKKARQPSLSQLLNQPALFSRLLAWFDTPSLLALSSVNARFRCEVLMPATPSLSCLGGFLEARTIVCPMALFEGLQDFIAKYKAFTPIHLHFTYCEQSSLMSLSPPPTKTALASSSPSGLPSTSPLSSSHLFGVNQAISINISSTHGLFQHHHPVQPPLPQLHPHSSFPYSSLQSYTSQDAVLCAFSHRLESTRTISSSSADSSMSDSESFCSATTRASSNTSSTSAVVTRSDKDQDHSQTIDIPHAGAHDLHRHDSTAPALSRSASPYTPTTSSSSSSSSSNSASGSRPDSIPLVSSGFELSYWQKFALNELFLRTLPTLKTLTIGRTDKPTRSVRDQDASGLELSAGVCFFLARCFNVMHDMPDTALESVMWMDVSSKDILLLVTMIELRDIMVDDRYWRRGYLSMDPTSTSTSTSTSDADEESWDGFYYLINQEGTEKGAPRVSPKSSNLKLQQHRPALESDTPFAKRDYSQRPTQSMSMLGHLVKGTTGSGGQKVVGASSLLSSSSSLSVNVPTSAGVSNSDPDHDQAGWCHEPGDIASFVDSASLWSITELYGQLKQSIR